MWDDDQDGTPEDYAEQAALVDELKERCYRLIERDGRTLPVNFGSGTITTCRVGDVVIKFEERRGIWVDVFCPGMSSANGDRAFTENIGDAAYLNRYRVREIVLPILRQAMILDDIVDAGGDGGRQGTAGESGA